MLTAECQNDRFAKVRGVCALLRSDLEISRQVYQNEPVYVIHDPVSFASHRVPLETYRILTALGPGRTLDDVFGKLVFEDVFAHEDEAEFFDLVTMLFRNSMIVLPFHDGRRIFGVSEQISVRVRRGRLMSLLFMQVPLANPDGFLNGTIHKVSWLFSRTFFVVWMLAAVAAVAVVASRFSELSAPFSGLLATGNLPFLWASFVVLKIWHEFGHGYACKKYGGRVPEMGTILIAGNPLAYVDATAAWSFPERTKRLIVMLGGMYFESLIAIPAVFVWAFASNPLVQACAFNVLVSATLVTVFFNLNPLMKFDGYFILSELLGIQNLRSRSEKYIHSILKRVCLGLNVEPAAESAGLKALFVTYGISSAVYRVWLVLSISMMVAQRFFMLGVMMAVFYIGSSLWATIKRTGRYLLLNPETESVRNRSRFVAAGLAVGIPAIVLLLPVPFGVVADGVIGAETEHYVRVDTPGEFGRFEVGGVGVGGVDDAIENVIERKVGNAVAVGLGTPLVSLTNHTVASELKVLEARRVETEIAWQIACTKNAADAARLASKLKRITNELDESRLANGQLKIESPANGHLVQHLPHSTFGTYLERGTVVAVVIDGHPVLRTWLSEEQLKTTVSESGTEVRFCMAGRSLQTHSGKILNVQPAAQSVFTEQALTFAGGGTILVDPETGATLEPMFQVEILPNDATMDLTNHGGRISLRFQRANESIGQWAVRNCLRFLHRLRVA